MIATSLDAREAVRNKAIGYRQNYTMNFKWRLL